jgi:SHS2 domain-containing protein
VEIPVPGVSALDHTADVGLEVVAPTLPELFLRGAKGAMWLVLERDAGADGAPAHPEPRILELAEESPEALFRAWLRALLLWEEMEEFVAADATLSLFPTPACGPPDGLGINLKARVEGIVDRGPRVREIKGVTLHGLTVKEVDGGWYGRVIFDV